MFWTWIGNAIALYVAVAISGHARIAGWGALLVASAVFGVVNFFVKPVVKLLSLPAIVLTLGAALFAINVSMLWLTDKLVAGLHFSTFGALVVGALVVWAVNLALSFAPGPWREQRKER